MPTRKARLRIAEADDDAGVKDPDRAIFGGVTKGPRRKSDDDRTDWRADDARGLGRGAVWPVRDEERPWAEAVVIKDGEFVFRNGQHIRFG